ncbi:hypothetical protein QMZ92_08565 [Streptomyces sp. HNM0645]|uniref:hypothetical protein n=1 Tax=Streptomyces sp. HNM0645 TaxID=2782343 RepID=UPI0024B79F78|nr:hypothetical protein [Streptomyces sp. HNM0645]MDI9884450.1 hypothetical protein [Streptomyces sp. HNM0645]
MVGEVVESFPAGGPRGSWPAEQCAARRRERGVSATVVMDLEGDAFLVVESPEPAEYGGS